MQAHGSTYETLLEDCNQTEARYLIEPDLDRGDQRALLQARQKTLEENEAELIAKVAELAGLDKQIEQRRADLETMPERVTPTMDTLAAAAAQSDELKLLVAMVSNLEIAVSLFKEGSRQRRQYEQMHAAQKQKLVALTPKPAEASDGTIPNPARAEPKKQLDELDVLRAKLAAEVETLTAAVKVDLPTLRERIEAFKDYEIGRAHV